MSLQTIPTCDICTKQKGQTNSWFVVFRGVAMKGLGRSKFTVFEWTVRVAAKKKAIHICGEGCLSTFISRELNNRTAVEPAKAEEQ